MEMHESKGKSYSLSDDGFVFSQAQITDSIRTRNREHLIDETRNLSDTTAA
jgi:hypothetical protein